MYPSQRLDHESRLQPHCFLFPQSNACIAAPVNTAVLPDRAPMGAEIDLEKNGYGTHSMRRTKAKPIYRRTQSLRAVQLLLRHTQIECTVRYLRIEVDDVLEMAEQTEV